MSGALDGQPVQVLIDTGSHMSVARADLVDQSKWKEKEVELQCVHGDIVSYPVADVTCELDGWKKFLLGPGLPIDFLICCDDHLSFAGVIPSNTSDDKISKVLTDESLATSKEVVMVLLKIGREMAQHQLEGL